MLSKLTTMRIAVVAASLLFGRALQAPSWKSAIQRRPRSFGGRRRLATMSASTATFGTLPAALQGIVAGLQSLPDDKYRYKQLLFWASQAPAAEASVCVPENKVPGCLSTVYVSASLDGDGRVWYVGDSDAQLTKGLVSLLVRGLSGATPDEIARVDPAFIKEAGIAASLTPGRNNGFVNMLAVMKNKAQALAAAPTDGGAPESDDDATRGPVARAMLEKLAMLQPTRLELVDESHRHAGHAGAKGFEGGESHFKLTIAADCFSGLARVKRHQLIYTVLGDIMDQIHALQISVLD